MTITMIFGVNNLTTGQSQVIRQTSLTSPEFTATVPLTIGHQYRYWVKSFDGAGNDSGWSSYKTFRVVQTQPEPANNLQGKSVAIGEDFMVVGVPGALGTGAVDIYEYDRASSYSDLDDDAWRRVQRIYASDAQSGDEFGFSVALSEGGTTIVVGAPGEDTAGSNAGAAYVFERNGSTGLWYQDQKLTAATGTNAAFGESVDIDDYGDTLVVGAPDRDVSGVGAVYKYEYSSSWNLSQTLVPSGAASDAHIGHDVAISDVEVNQSIFFSAMDPYHGADSSTWVYVYRTYGSSTTFYHAQTFTPLYGELDYGASIDVVGGLGLSKSILAVSAPASNAVYTYIAIGSSYWAITAPPMTGAAGTEYGSSVSLSNDNDGVTLVIGAASNGTGVAHVYRSVSGSGYTWLDTISNPNGGTGDRFGDAVSIEGDRLVVGAPEVGSSSGLGFVFRLDVL